MTLQLKQPVPDFIVPSTHSKNVQLSHLKGQRLLFYFYPKNNTPSCIIEAQNFAAHHQDFKDKNITVFGVSRDSLDSQIRFKRQYSLPFHLISDVSEGLCRLFGVLTTKLLFDQQVVKLTRSTFLIDQEGQLERAWRNVDVGKHVQEILAEL